MKWIIPANEELYNFNDAFKRGFIDWSQKKYKYNVGDIVYIYCCSPYMRIMYKTIIEKINIKGCDIEDDSRYYRIEKKYNEIINNKYIRLKLILQIDSEELSLKCLKENGLKAAPQGANKIKNDKLLDYIENCIKHESNKNNIISNNQFLKTNVNEKYYEGSVSCVLSKKYERSLKARKKCIDYYGSKCLICGFDFEKIYGTIGKNFIHIHHIIPLNSIKTKYKVNYKNDLIPVCPNCHAMLHRTINNKNYSWQELKNIIMNNKQ